MALRGGGRSCRAFDRLRASLSLGNAAGRLREETWPPIRGDTGWEGHDLSGIRVEGQGITRRPVTRALLHTLRTVMRFPAFVVAGLLTVGVLVGRAQQPVMTVPLTPPAPVVVDGLEVLPVQGTVHMIAGAGANVAVQVGDEGPFIVDAGAAGQGQRLLSAVSRLSKRPVRFLVNTSADGDHIAGNEAIVKSQRGTRGPQPGGGGGGAQGQNVGVVSVAHENAFNRMSTGSPGVPPLTGAGLPASTFFTPRKDLFSNGEPVQLISQPAAHTAGDLLVFF